MTRGFDDSPRLTPRHIGKLSRKAIWILAGFLLVFPWGVGNCQEETKEIADITGKYDFLSAADTLALLEEDGKLKGYIDVFQGEDESDEVLSYSITTGSRKNDQVEFKTSTIHQKYYRFSGTVQRGKGHEPTDPDYLRLVGRVEIVTVKSETRDETVQRFDAVLKSMGRAETEEK